MNAKTARPPPGAPNGFHLSRRDTGRAYTSKYPIPFVYAAQRLGTGESDKSAGDERENFDRK